MGWEKDPTVFVAVAAGLLQLRRLLKPFAPTLAPALLVVLLTCGSACAGTAPFQLSNGQVEVGVGREHGELVRLADAHSGQNFAGPGVSGAGLWEVTLGPTNRLLLPTDARVFHCQPLSGKDLGLRLTWEGFGVVAAPELRVEVVVRLEPGQPMSRWELGVDRLGRSLASGRSGSRAL